MVWQILITKTTRTIWGCSIWPALNAEFMLQTNKENIFAPQFLKKVLKTQFLDSQQETGWNDSSRTSKSRDSGQFVVVMV